MEWVETTGKTVEEAKEMALDQLGVDEQDAEFEVVAEPKGGLFGRLRSEARVRARVRPTTPRPKDDRRERRRRGAKSGERSEKRERPERSERPKPERAPRAAVATEDRPKRAKREENGKSEAREVPEMTLAEQADVGRQFLDGLVSQFSAEATVTVEPVDDDTIRLAVRGGELGLLIGPKGQTLQAIQELVRTVVQRHTTSREGWLVVDVADYRQKRKAALERFAANVAEQVIQTGRATSLEPMSPGDRKVVHDAINEIDGVTTHSEGEEPRRWVVVAPASAG